MILPRRFVVDASVAVKWYVPEGGSDEASTLLRSGQPLLAPDLLVAEFGSILWKKVRRGALTPDEASAIVETFLSTDAVELRPANDLLPGALQIAVRYDRTVYDSLYLALGITEGCAFVTADVRLRNALAGTALDGLALSLAELQASA